MRALLLTVVIGGCASQSSVHSARREAMVREQIEARGVKDARVLAAMRKVPRHLFVPDHLVVRAYEDRPLPIGDGQTISQPYIVARMTELAQVKPNSRVLEVGTGSGYQAAILAELAREVYTIEIVPELAKRAGKRLAALGYTNVHVLTGDGWRGWPEHAPFDAIVVTASPDSVPPALQQQLADRARLVIPVREKLLAITRGGAIEEHDPVRFVPMTGEAQKNAR
jgi:protein-L-isoaspartate(D-aspartate) O-methyltransferase